jgi:cytidylate kinase
MDNFVITIARAYGSGGKEIAMLLSEKLNIPVVDREILELASIESGISEEIFTLSDEKVKRNLFRLQELFDLSNFGISGTKTLFEYQSRILRNKAMKDSFIVIGRASSYILRTFPRVFSVNIQAPHKDCVQVVMNRKGISEEQAEKDVHRINMERSNFYRFHTGSEWTDPEFFDLIMNTGRISQKECVEMIIQCAEVKFNRKII